MAADNPGTRQSGEVSPLDDSPIVIHGPLHGAGLGSGDHSTPVVERSASLRAALAPDPLPASTSEDLAAPVTPAPREPAAALVETAPESRRALGLDALRGFFLVLMTVSFTTQAGLLPLWLYHAQTPPPTFALVNVPGIGWPDLAYPAFIFAMAAALPIALSRRIDAGETEVGVLLGAFRRFILLFAFAVLIGHSNTYFIGYTQTGRALAVLGFVIMFAIFVRRRSDWPDAKFAWVNRAGWVAGALFLALSPLAYDSSFSPARRDEIIAYLAVASLFATALWYFTRNNLNLRLAALGAVVALYLGARGEGWIQSWWWSSPAPWLFRPTDLGVMLAAIPGTIAGDQILRWMRAPSDARTAAEVSNPAWSSSRVGALALLCLAFMPVTVHGLYERWVEATTYVVLFLCMGGALLTLRPTSATEKLLRDLFAWGVFWLLLGLFLEPSEGGIKKVPDTLSYFFTVTGVATMLLVTMTALVEVLGRRKTVAALIDVGHNPMLCYVLYTIFINSILEMIPPLRGVLRESAGAELLRAAISTIGVVLVVRVFTRKRIFWRT